MIDLAAEYLQGVQLGASIKARKQQMQQDQQQAQLEAQTRQQQIAQQGALASARLKYENALQHQTLQLSKLRLDQVEKANAQRTQAAAMKLAEQQSFARDLAGGMPMQQALLRHPNLATPAAAMGAVREGRLSQEEQEREQYRAQQLSAQDKAMALRKRALDLSETALNQRTQAQQAKATAPPMVTMQTADTMDAPRASVRLPANSPLINQMMGTNAPPGLGTNYQAGAGAPAIQPAPRDPKQRQPNTPYITPKHGPLLWTGTNWVDLPKTVASAAPLPGAGENTEAEENEKPAQDSE